MIKENPTKPLAGIRVLDLSHVMAGPYATLFLALNGAEVIKIETPEGGELARRLVLETKDGRDVDHVLAYLNRGKKALTLNLRSEEGQKIFKDLVKVSDIVVENFTPSTMKRFGLDYETLKQINPRLIYTSISGFGHDDIYQSPYMDRPAFNLIAQAMSGIMDISGDADGPPVPSGVAIGDLTAGIFAVAGTLMALQHRNLTGEGQHVDISLYDSLASFSQRAVMRYFLTDEIPTRGRDSRENPLGTFKVSDGHVVMTTMGDAMWARFCRMIGRDDLRDHPDLNPDTARGKRYETVLKPILEEWARDMTREEVAAKFRDADLPSAPVQNAADLLSCPHLKARRMLEVVDDPKRGRLVFTGNPMKLSNVEEETPSHAPMLGEHTDRILADLLGADNSRIAEWRAGKVI